MKSEEVAKKVEACKTMYITLVNEDNKPRLYMNFIRRNFNMRFEREKETATMTLFTKPLVYNKDGQEVPVGQTFDIVGVEITSDPTPKDSLGVVSLGYHRLLWLFKNPQLIKRNPPTFRGWWKMFKMNLLTPMREQYE